MVSSISNSSEMSVSYLLRYKVAYTIMWYD